MARKATSKGSKKGRAKKSSAGAGRGSGSGKSSAGAGDVFIKLLQSPLVTDLVAVAATAALGALAEEGVFRGGGTGKRAGRAVKRAGKAAANAIGRRLGDEIDEIKKAAKAAKGGAKA